MNLKFHFVIALILRLIVVAIGYIQDAFLDVKFTDVDYIVFTDAARYVSKGSSPYERHTYRYTPILSYLLLPNITIHDAYGKVLFNILDILTSLLIYNIQKKTGFSIDICCLCTFMWLYNPIVTVISARGNAESVLTFLIMLSIYFHQIKVVSICGIVYGLSVHFKIYPCIYALSFYFALNSTNVPLCGWKKLASLLYPNRQRITFMISALFGFALPTLISFYLYKYDYVKEAFLYHLIRKDIRHNFSPYFYLLYLSELLDPWLSGVLSSTAFILQGFLITLISWVFVSPQNLPFAMFLQTFVFVTFNKVCTSQYFLWYLCLLPLSYPLLGISLKNFFLPSLLWISGQIIWLASAYHLEFLGENTFIFIWLSSLLFFTINVYVICLLIKFYNHANIKMAKIK